MLRVMGIRGGGEAGRAKIIFLRVILALVGNRQ